MKSTLAYLVGIILVGFIIYSTLIQINKQNVPGKLNRLECHKNITAFERVYDKFHIEEIQKILLSGNLKITSDIDKAKYMESTLFQFISVEDTDKFLNDYLKKKTAKDILYKDGITIDYTIYENDIEDPKKKSDNCKLFRGYIVLKIKNSNNKTLYQVQIDFMDKEGKDIYKTLECGIDSFLTY